MFEVISQGTYIPLEEIADETTIESMKTYSRLVIHPLKFVGFVGEEATYMPCPAEVATLWRIYGQCGETHSFHILRTITDFPNEAAAFRFSRKLLTDNRNLKEIAYQIDVQD